MNIDEEIIKNSIVICNDKKTSLRVTKFEAIQLPSPCGEGLGVR